MSINNIDLPPYCVAALYSHFLVADTAGEQASTTMAKSAIAPTTRIAEDKQWKYLGNNLKNILILVHNAEAVHLPDNELSFLTSILVACKLSVADVAIINRQLYPTVGYDVFTTNLQVKTMLLFGISPLAIDLPLNFPAYQVQHFNGVNYIHGPALTDIEKNKEQKMQLWNSLKRVFEI